MTGDHLGRAKKGEKEACVCASNHQVHTKHLQTMKIKLDRIKNLLFYSSSASLETHDLGKLITKISGLRLRCKRF